MYAEGAWSEATVVSFFGTMIKDSGVSAHRMQGTMWYWSRLKDSRTWYGDCSGLSSAPEALGLSKVIIERRSHHGYTGLESIYL